MFDERLKVIYNFRMSDTSEDESSQLSLKLQETPSLAKVKKILSLEEAGEALKISNVPISVGGFIIGGVPGKSRMRESFGASTRRKQDEVGRESLVGYARTGFGFGSRDIKKVVTRKQISKARHMGGRQIFKRAMKISSTSSSSGEDEEEEKREVKVFKKWNMIDSDEEEDTVGQAGAQRPDNENNSAETGWHSHTYVGPEEARPREEVLREHTPPSSSLGPSPHNSPVQSAVQETIDSLERDLKQEERRREKDAKKRKDEMLDEMMLRLLEEKEKRCTEERQREFFRTAAHLIKCRRGCEDTR